MTPRICNAQVRELWRTGLTNSVNPTGPAPQYHFVNAAVDQDGGTIVGGTFGFSGANNSVGFVTKFDARGQKAWEFRTDSLGWDGCDALEVDGFGNSYITYRVILDAISETRWLAKVTHDGQLAWQTTIYEGSNISQFHLIVNNAGEAAATGIQYREVLPGKFTKEQWVVKYDPLGNRQWRSFLPGYCFGWSSVFDSKPIAFAPDGSVIVVGTAARSALPTESSEWFGFVASCDSRGDLRWRTEHKYSSYAGVMANRYGMVGAVGDNSALLNKRGRTIDFEPVVQEVLAETSQGNFLVGCPGGYMILPGEWDVKKRRLKWRCQWRDDQPLLHPWDVCVFGPDTYVVMTPAVSDIHGLMFVRLDGDGEERWRQEFPNYNLAVGGFILPRLFLLAKDKTIRVVGYYPSNLPSTMGGISVGAFALANRR